MKAVLLDGSLAADHTGERLRAALTSVLETAGWDVEHVALRDRTIGNCAGDFFCWIRTPGVCNVDDDNRAIAADLVTSDLAVFLTPVTFGGYAPTLKRMVEHLIQNISPFFTKIAGETHHKKRYATSPDLLAVGWTNAPDPQAELVFRHLAQRNALNFHVRTCVSAVVLESRSDEELLASAQEWLNDVQSGRSSEPVELPSDDGTVHESIAIRRALLLVGSPKGRKSTSNALGAYLLDRLRDRSVQTETMFVYPTLHSPAKMHALLDSADAADLVTLAFPLYIDAVPAAAVEVLERIAARRRDHETRARLFTAIANCGFPEARHNAPALAICRLFAQRAGFAWAGALGLGAGGMIDGVPLMQCGGKTKHIRESLDVAAAALAQGRGIPKVAQDGLAKSILPDWLYRVGGNFGWRRLAKSYGAQKLLTRQPYAG